MVIDIPDEILRKPGYGEHEFMVDIAVILYQGLHISLGKAARLEHTTKAFVRIGHNLS